MIRTIAIAGVIAACTALGGCAGNSARFLIDPPASGSSGCGNCRGRR